MFNHSFLLNEILRNIIDLFRSALDATNTPQDTKAALVHRILLRLDMRRYFMEILGEIHTWLRFHPDDEEMKRGINEFSEYHALVQEPHANVRKYLNRVVLETEKGDFHNVVFRSVYEVEGGNPYPNEHWYYINGMVINDVLIKYNARYLNKLFNRRVTVLHNPTHGFMHDLAESISGRVGLFRTQPEIMVADYLSQALRVYPTSKVVVLCHSQGTIITSGAIRRLIKTNNEDLQRMEVYTFAFCANAFPQNDQGYPYVEHFANKKDFVARLGAVPVNKFKIPGDIYTTEWSGHLFNAHYLCGIETQSYQYDLLANGYQDKQADQQKFANKSPRLYRYLVNAKPQD